MSKKINVPAEGVDDTELDSTDQKVFITVMREISSILDWSMLALYLGISRGTVDRIAKDSHRNYTEQQAYVRAWLDTGEASWARLVHGLRNIDKKGIANTIARKYPSGQVILNSEEIPVRPDPEADDTLLSTDDFLDVMEQLENITEWSIISILLGVSEKTLGHIRKDHPTAHSAEQAIVRAWLEDTTDPSWAVLVAALKDKLVGKTAIGKRIARKYPAKPGSQSSNLAATVSNPSEPTTKTFVKDNELGNVFDLLKPKYHKWDDIGRGLGVEYNFRQELLTQGVSTSAEQKLEAVIHKWYESKCSDDTWENLASVMRKLQFNDVAENIMKRLS